MNWLTTDPQSTGVYLMGRSFFWAVSVFIFFSITSAAQATIACSVVSDEAEVESVNLYSDPDPTSGIVREIPVDDLVMYPESTLAPKQTEGWVWVRHDSTQEDIWQCGVYGWIKIENISDCG
jgi:hypothetical protein